MTNSDHQASQEPVTGILGIIGSNQRWAFVAALKGGDTSQQRCISK